MSAPRDVILPVHYDPSVLSNQLNEIRALLNGGIRPEHLAANTFEGTSPVAPDTPFTLTHTLNRTPAHWLAILDKSGSLYATTADRAAWSATQVTLRCSAASAWYRLLLW